MAVSNHSSLGKVVIQKLFDEKLSDYVVLHKQKPSWHMS